MKDQQDEATESQKGAEKQHVQTRKEVEPADQMMDQWPYELAKDLSPAKEDKELSLTHSPSPLLRKSLRGSM